MLRQKWSTEACSICGNMTFQLVAWEQKCRERNSNHWLVYVVKMFHFLKILEKVSAGHDLAPINSGFSYQAYYLFQVLSSGWGIWSAFMIHEIYAFTRKRSKSLGVSVFCIISTYQGIEVAPILRPDTAQYARKASCSQTFRSWNLVVFFCLQRSCSQRDSCNRLCNAMELHLCQFLLFTLCDQPIQFCCTVAN